MVFLCKFCQNSPIGSGDRMQTRLIFTVFIVWWPLKLGHGHQNLNNFLIIPMIQYKKFGQNLSFGSRDRMQTSFFWSKFNIQSADVTLKMRSMSPKSNHFFPMFQWCFCATLVKIHHLFQEIRVQTMLIITMWWPWNLGQGHQNLIKSLNHPNITIWSLARIMSLCKFGKNPPFGSGDSVQTRSYADADRICIKSNMSPLHFSCGEGGDLN